MSTLGNGFGPTPIIDGAFAAHVVSVGAYTFINDALYLEATVYTTLRPGAQNDLGTDPFGSPGLFSAAPYWRAAFEPHWGNHWLRSELSACTPRSVRGRCLERWIRRPFRTDNYTDIGFDTQYQYQGSNFWITLRGNYIHEY